MTTDKPEPNNGARPAPVCAIGGSAGGIEALTEFFRDPDSWAALKAQVIVPLLERTDPDEQIRVWVPACAGGEEAYTVAMLFEEERVRRKPGPPAGAGRGAGE